MPRSKRARLVPLTKTSKRATREHKSTFIQEVRDAVDKHQHLYLFSYENMRSNKFKDIRMHFRANNNDNNNNTTSAMTDDDDDNGSKNQSSRIFLGKNKLMQVALGKTPEDEYADNLRHVSKHITESVGLLCTSKPCKEVEEYFMDFSQPDYARAGFTCPHDVYVTNEMLSNHPVSMVEQQFRKLGLPVKIDNGKVVLLNNIGRHKLCKEGEILSAEKCKALTHFGIKLSEFRVKLVCRWSNTGEFDMLE